MKRDIPYPKNVLMSYHYFKDYDLNKLTHLNIIGDSGAFSATSQGAIITTKELADWGKKWRHKLAWVASLDVIGNPKATYRNWRDMVDNHGVQAVPTIHFGDDPSEMDKYAARGVDFMGLGGLVGVQGKPQMRWMIQVFKYQQRNHPQMRFHGWGCTSERHAALPFYSVDSSSWTGSMRFGLMRLKHPRTGKNFTYLLDDEGAFRPEISKLLIDHYGVSPKTVSFSNSTNRADIVRVSALAASVQEQQLRKLHKSISAPVWGINGTQSPGPHLHLADSDEKNLGTLDGLLKSEPGPHLHLATGGRDDVVLNTLHEPEPGPHLDLAVGSATGNTNPGPIHALHEEVTND